MRAALIPAYNEEARIAPVILKAKKYVDIVIVCDDGSTDLTREISRSLGAEVVRHERNMGYGAALHTLFSEALRRGVDVAVTLDADGQHDPDFIPDLIEPIEKGEADLVVGSRFIRGGSAPGISPTRKLALKILNSLGRKATKLTISDTQSGMRAYSKRALKAALEAMEKGMAVSLGILKEVGRAGLKVREVPIRVSYKETKPSKNPFLHFSELFTTIMRIVLEEKPLLYLGMPGVIFLFISLYFGWWALSLYLSTRYFSIPMALISVGSLMTGFLLIITSFQLYSIYRIRLEMEKLRADIEASRRRDDEQLT